MDVPQKKSKKRSRTAAPDLAAVAADIDSLFASLGAKKKERALASSAASTAASAAAAVAARETAARAARVAALEAAGAAANGRSGRDSPQALRFDASIGMRIFSVDALQIGKGGGDTRDCPFDCECCF